MKKKLLLIGGGGHCHSVIDSVLSMGLFDEIGIVDYTDSSCLGISVIGKDEDIPLLKKTGWNYAFISVGSIGDNRLRRRLYRMVKEWGLLVPTIIDSTAAIANGTRIEEGCFVGKKAIINTGSTIHACSIINTGSIIEHDCEIGEFVHVSPGSTLCGQVFIGQDTHIGAGSVVRQKIRIGSDSIIGAGSVVVKDIPVGVTAYGNPCKVAKK